MLRTTLFFLGVVLLLLSACQNNDNRLPMIEPTRSIPIERFELAFGTKSIPLQELKASYPYLFPIQTPDSIWLNKRNDTLEHLLIKAVDSVFGDFNRQQQEIDQLFSNYQYYFPTAIIPKKGITLTTSIDYFSRVIYADSLLLLGLDNFLGATHPFYQNFPSYLRSTMTPEDLIPALAAELAKKQLSSTTQGTFLSKIIQEGKLLYVQERLSPKYSMAKQLGYSQEKYEWATRNEPEIWRYFIDNELLYSTDKQLDSRFIKPAPFSKFNSEIDQESPGGIGRYIGYRIVSSYMNTTNVSIPLLLEKEAVHLLKNAKFKPNK